MLSDESKSEFTDSCDFRRCSFVTYFTVLKFLRVSLVPALNRTPGDGCITALKHVYTTTNN